MKLVVSWSGKSSDRNQPEKSESVLFDLEEDPNERHNLANDRPRLVEEMLVRMRSFQADRGDALSPGPAQPTEIEEGLRDSLESLGYVAPREDQGSQ